MKKNWRLGMAGLLALLTLSSCTVGEVSSSGESSEDEIYKVYKAYQENGGTLSYEDWLSSIKGEKGEKGDTGAQGPKGDQGEPGKDGQDGKDGANGVDGKDGRDGSSLLTGSGIPSDDLGKDGDSYIDTSTFDYYTKENSAWTKVGNIKGEKGQKGEDGKTVTEEGAISGEDGASVLTGSGAPSSDLGKDGDSYIDTLTFDYYVKADGSWSKVGNLKGEDGKDGADGVNGKDGQDGKDGANGKDGVDGKDGTSLRTGNGVPPSSLGKDGDSYIDLDTFDYYVKDDGLWTKQGNIKGKDGSSGQGVVTYVPAIFYNYNGVKLYEFYYEKGSTIVYDGPTPIKGDSLIDGHEAHWTWTGWDKSLENITQPTIFTAQFEATVNVTFQNYDGTVLESKSVSFGSEATYTGLTPTRPTQTSGSKTIEWTFAGWDQPFGPLYEDTVYTATYDSPNKLKCTFLNDDGTELSTSYCLFGEQAVYAGSTPRKEEVNVDGTITRYTFAGWDKSLYRIQDDTVFTAKYEESTYYTVDFLDKDGNKLTSAEVKKGESADYSKFLSKAVDACYSYDSNNVTMFVGWSGSLDDITSPKEVTVLTKTISREQNGEYPQTKVSDSSLISALSALSEKDSQGYYQYEGERYAKVDGTWRKVEPIKWRYLRSVSAGVCEFISEKILAFHGWNKSTSDREDGTHANNYAKSEVRGWLNEDFLNQAFYGDQSLLLTPEVDNTAASTNDSSNAYVCENTSDKIYLPSYQDVNNASYGFSSQDDRIAYDSDGDASYWWTRSPWAGSSEEFVSCITPIGYLRGSSSSYSDGIRPCVQFSIA